MLRTEGSPIRRIGHARWLRNVAVAAGNALATGHGGTALRAALERRLSHESALVQEHVAWALAQGDGQVSGVIVPTPTSLPNPKMGP